MMKARKVIEKAPMKFMKRPKRGTRMENTAVQRTVAERYKMLFNYQAKGSRVTGHLL